MLLGCVLPDCVLLGCVLPDCVLLGCVLPDCVLLACILVVMEVGGVEHPSKRYL